MQHKQRKLMDYSDDIMGNTIKLIHCNTQACVNKLKCRHGSGQSIGCYRGDGIVVHIAKISKVNESDLIEEQKVRESTIIHNTSQQKRHHRQNFRHHYGSLSWSLINCIIIIISHVTVSTCKNRNEGSTPSRTKPNNTRWKLMLHIKSNVFINSQHGDKEGKERFMRYQK